MSPEVSLLAEIRGDALERRQRLHQRITRSPTSDSPEHILREVQASLEAGSAIAYLTTTTWRSDIILIQRDEISTIPLPGLEGGELGALCEEHSQQLELMHESVDQVVAARAHALADGGIAATRAYVTALDGYGAARRQTDSWLTQLLERLWDQVAEPLVSRLGSSESDWWNPENPGRLWWCPVWGFNILPIHAAGHHTNRSTENVVDRTLSSYTSSLRSWRRASLLPAATAQDPRLLLVSSARESGYETLHEVERERAVLTAKLGAENVCDLDGSAATRSSVVEAISRHAVVHYAGHGVHERADPRWGGFVLWDGILTLQDIMRVRTNAELAVLTACQSAAPTYLALDEGLNIASALHHQGFRQVIASMWPVLDAVVVTLVDEVYTRLVSEGALDAALACSALAGGVATVRRELDGHKPYSWAGYVHLGVAEWKSGSDDAR